ncbi:MAG: ergothioneine biosynthesis protein EgtB [Rhodospirillales bacterium]
MGERARNIPADDDTGSGRAEIQARLADVRARTMVLASPLSAEDQCIQSMPDASPTKWHLAHTSWFFETFILLPFDADYQAFHPDYNYLFNSYYDAVGPRHARPERGLLSRPPLEDVHAYRRHVEDALERLFAAADGAAWARIAPLLELGLHHEQQHQELLLTDIKHVFSCNPLRPAYEAFKPHGIAEAQALTWLDFPEGLRETGDRSNGFAFDNEGPRHKVWLNAFRIASRPVTNGEFLEFIDAGGYRQPEWWLSDGWAACRAEGWEAPLYWERTDGGWRLLTLAGMRALDPAEPVCHVSCFEADAFARWAGKRLPTEAEWETMAAAMPVAGNFADSGHFHPVPAEPAADGAAQVFGDVWEWTGSAYSPYPGYRPSAGAIGEYNGKFMSGQMVLRGGSAATPVGHVRATYRNFFYPPDRWQFSGLRLAEDA